MYAQEIGRIEAEPHGAADTVPIVDLPPAAGLTPSTMG